MFKKSHDEIKADNDTESALASICLDEDAYHSEETEEFFSAIKNKNFDRVQFYLEKGIDPNAFLVTCCLRFEQEYSRSNRSTNIYKSHTALTEACRCGDMRIINLLIDKGAQINTNDCIYSPLNTAIIENNLPLIKLLVDKGVDLNLTGAFQEHSLLKAICSRRTSDEVITYLINQPAMNLELIREALNPLMAAAHDGRSNVIEMLAQRGVNLETKMQRDMCLISKGTALTIAIERKFAHACDMLLRYGADINNPTVCGTAPIVLAVNHRACLEALIDSEQAFLIEKESLRQAYKKAKKHPEICSILQNFIEKYDCVHQIIELYRPIALPPDYHVSYLDLELLTACQQGDFNGACSLLEKGANPNAATMITISNLPSCFTPISYHSRSVLSHACESGQTNIADLLIRKGAHTNRPDCAQSSLSAALSWYLQSNNDNFELIKLLIQANADINSFDIENDTALLTAIKKDRRDLVAFLFQHGASLDKLGKEKLNAIELCASLNKLEVLKYFHDQHADITAISRNAFYLSAINRNVKIIKFFLHIGMSYHISEKIYPNSYETRQFVNARLFENVLHDLQNRKMLNFLPEGSSLKKLAKRFLLDNLCERDNINILYSEFELVCDLLKQSPVLMPYFDEIASHYLTGCVNQPTWGFLEMSGWTFIASQADKSLKKGIQALSYIYSLEIITSFVESFKDISLNFKAESACILLREIYKKVPHHPDIFPYIPEAIPFEHHCNHILSIPIVQEFINNTAHQLIHATEKELLDYVLLESRQIYQIWAEITLPQITATLCQKIEKVREDLKEALLAHIECDRISQSDQDFEKEELKSLPIHVCGLYFTNTPENLYRKLDLQIQEEQQLLLQEVSQRATDYLKEKNKSL